ncbi:MAG TPA: Coq4 family protein [Candidatus Binatia bacterium]|jgi:ubiquinone biosynthesis protein COQ4
MEPTLQIGPPPPMRIEWGRAFRAIRALLADPDRTELAFEAISAVSARDFERLFQGFIAHPEGRRLFVERPSLLAALSDRARLRAMPEGSFGRAYAAFMDTAQLTAAGLVEADLASEEAMGVDYRDEDRRWFSERLRDMHDLWHVLDGYGRDEAGEAANLAFSQAQLRFRGITLILIAGALIEPYGSRFAWPRYLVNAWRRGRRTTPLVVARYEDLLERPLDEVRRALGVEPPQLAHPDGIIVAYRRSRAGLAALASAG